MNNATPIGGFSSAGAARLKQMAENPEMYTEFLKFQGRVFKHNTSIALEFFAQNPDAKFIATGNQWRNLRYTMQAGTSGIQFVDGNGHQTEFFDLSQTHEQRQPRIWTLNKRNAIAVKSELGIPQKESILTGTLRQTAMPEITECMQTLHISPQNTATFRKAFTQAVQSIMAGRLEMNGSSFNVPANPDFFKSLKSDEERFLFLSYAAKTANRALLKIEKATNDIANRNRAGLLPETEQKKRDNLEDLQELVRISVAITLKEKEFTALFHQTEHNEDKPYDKMAEISKEISDLKLEYRTLNQNIKKQNITAEDIAMLRKIYPKRISVQNLTEHQIAETVKFQNLLDEELGEKSPYRMRQTDNTWHEDESKRIPVITIAKKDVSHVRDDVRNGRLERGDFVNKDTGITVNYGNIGINDSFAHALREIRKHKSPEVQFATLYQMRDLIENAVQFDTQLSDNKKKSPNSLFMHKFYAVFQYENQYYLANLSVDESCHTDKDGNLEDTSKKLYNAKSIKITPIGDNGFSLGTNSETSEQGESPTSVTEISIPQLYQIVKTYDKNFFENPHAPNREAREAEIYAHAQYIDANNALKDKEHKFTPAETEKQVSRIAQAHGQSESETVSMLEKLVKVYSRFPADNTTAEKIAANFDADFAGRVKSAFDDMEKNQKFSPRQKEFMDALKDFAVTNQVSNNLIDRALAECSRFRSEYTDRKRISQNIFYGRLGKTETELQNYLKKHLPSFNVHDAFKEVIKQQQSEKAREILRLAENQMQKLHTPKLVPLAFSMPEFRKYGSFQNIDENLFGGRLKEIINQINQNLQPEKKEEIPALEQTAPVSALSESPEQFSEENLHRAFEQLLEKHNFPENTQELLNRIEKQMSVNQMHQLNPKLLLSPVFAHSYGNFSRINQNFFDGNLKNIIDEINQNLQSENKEGIREPDTPVPEQSVPVSSSSESSEKEQVSEIPEPEKLETVEVIKEQKHNNSETVSIHVTPSENAAEYGFKERNYSVLEFNKALNNFNEKWFADWYSKNPFRQSTTQGKSAPIQIIVQNGSDRYETEMALEKEYYYISEFLEKHTDCKTTHENLLKAVLQAEDEPVVQVNPSVDAEKYGFEQRDYSVVEFNKLMEAFYHGQANESISLFITVKSGENEYRDRMILNKEKDIIVQNKEKPKFPSLSDFLENSGYMYFELIDNVRKAEKLAQNQKNAEILNQEKESEVKQTENDILQKNQQIIDTIEVSDEITLHGETFTIQSIQGDFSMSMDAKNPQNGEIVTRQFIGDWKKDLLAEAGSELISVRKKAEMRAETVPEEQEQQIFTPVPEQSGEQLVLFEEQKIYQVVTYDNDSGADDKRDFFNLNDAVEEGRQYLAEGYAGFAVLNKEEHKIETYEGYFPEFGIFSEQVYRNSGMWQEPEKSNIYLDTSDEDTTVVKQWNAETEEYTEIADISDGEIQYHEEHEKTDFSETEELRIHAEMEQQKEKLSIQNLNQLKKNLQTGMEFEILAHVRPECVGEHRRITSVNTVGFTSQKIDENGELSGKDIHMEWDKAGNWKFENNQFTSTLDNGQLVMSFRLVDNRKMQNSPEISTMSDSDEILEAPVQKEPEEITLEFTGSSEKLSAIKDKALSLGATISENFETNTLTVHTYENHRDEIQNTADEFSESMTNESTEKHISWKEQDFGLAKLDTVKLVESLQSGDCITYKGEDFIVGSIMPVSDLISPKNDALVDDVSYELVYASGEKNGAVSVFATNLVEDGFEVVYREKDRIAQAQENHRKTRSERLYEKFAELFPEVVSGEHTYERYGNYDENGGIEPVSVEHLGGETYGMMSYYIQNGDVMRDPDFTFNLKKEAKRLEILEYQQDGVPVLGSLYQRVYDDNGNPDIRLQNELEKNLEQVLKSIEYMRKPLSEYEDREGNRVKTSNAEEPEITEQSEDISEDYEETEEVQEEINPDKTPHLREVLNQFSEKHNLGELNVASDNRNYWRLNETLRDGTIQTLGTIDSPPEYGMPFTPETLQKSLDSLEKSAEIRGQKISEIYGRQEAVANHGGISELPKIQKNLPEISYASSPLMKISDNLTAIREMIRLEKAEQEGDDLYDPRSNQYNSRQNSENRLRRYSGWGGVPQLFDESFPQYKAYREQLQKLLTAEEYAEIRSSTLNSHYTPQIVIDAMYKAVQNMDLPRDARILEPSCGTGNFISRMPNSLGDAHVVGVELDSITARIAKQLHRENDNVEIIHSGFEHAGLENNSFDLAIGNVPFGDYNLNDPDYADNWRIHDAFFRKALDKVAAGGVVAFVTSCGTMDKKNPKIREYLAERAELVGAVRLPENAFSSAGTKTPTDIIFLKKRESPLKFEDKKPDWCYTVPDPNGSGLNINSYFAQNPQMVLGKIEKSSFQGRMTCVPFPDADLKLQLDEAIKNLNAKITVSKREKAFAERQGKIEPWGKNFSFHVKDDKVYYRQGDSMEETKCTDSERKQITMLCELRTAARNLIAMQRTTIHDEDLIPLRNELNQKYDAYQKEFGLLTDKKVNKLFGMDSDYPILLSLEDKKHQKADIFTKRTVNAAVEITSVGTLEEALQVSLDRKGKPDIQYMAALLSDKYQMPFHQLAEHICNELLEQGHIFIDPEKNLPDKPYSGVVERSEYLSGNVRMKLLFAEEHAKMNPEYQRNVDALKQVIPEDIKAEEISVRMGCTWIDTEDYSAFLQHLSGRSKHDQRCNVMYSPATGEYEIMNARSQTDLNQNETVTYGTNDYNLYELAQKILNQRRIVVKKEVPDPNDSSKTITRTDPKATKIAIEKSKAIQQEFADWIFSSPERKEKYERRYNDVFNSLVGRNYDGSHLTFSGLANDFTLRPHQKNCVARAVYGGNTLAAHVVGAGKSAVMFTSVMKKKELGLINKACVVVPKALTEQTANEWRRLYPDAKILTVTNEDLSTEARRNLFTARVATGSYDAVVMSQEQFEKIPMSREYRIKFMQREIDSLADALREKKLESNGRRDYSVKKIEKAKKQLEIKLENLLNPKGKAKGKDNLLEFEQLGFDFLVCDEAHAYKNGFVTTKMTNVAGVTTRPSGRAEDMQMKTDYFNQNLGQGHILFCTGTPVSNSMTELYVMTRYLRPDLLMQAGVSRFDDWAATFGNVVMKNQQSADGTLKLKTCFAKFANLPELMAMYKEFADIQSADKLQLPRPALKDGKPTIVKVPASPEQKEYVRELADRARLISEGKVDSSDDNLLKITGEARQIGLGNQAIAALYRKRGEELPEDFLNAKDSKVDKCVENVAKIYHEKKEENVTAVQIIFSDIAVNSDNGNFSVYDYLKKELMEKGIPEEEIIFAPKADAKNREAIFKDINAGKYKVVIASTGTLGTGANIQENLYALHHVDIPWKPSDFEQREGRILRQGNNFDEVQIFNYVTEGTLDSYLYQTVTDKARFIAQLMDDKCPARVSEDCDEKVLTFGEIQAAAEGNPDFRRRIELGNEIEELKMLKREHAHETSVLKQKIQEIPDEIAEKQQTLEKIRQDKSSAESIQDFTLETETGTVLKEKKDMNTHLLGMVQKMINNPAQTSPKAKIGNFNLSVFVNTARDKIKFLLKGNHGYNCDAGINEHQDNVQRLQNLLTKIIPKREEETIHEIENLQLNLKQAEERVVQPFSREQELQDDLKEFQELEDRLSGLSEQTDSVYDPEDIADPVIETKEEKSEREALYNTDNNDYQPTEEDDLNQFPHIRK
ncbi:MAG: methyltransferase domain-containing protein [Oscillospiraceae bacterium]|nr:methyltransferase domain-containing protein [Oscillospiraceae bacterium]